MQRRSVGMHAERRRVFASLRLGRLAAIGVLTGSGLGCTPVPFPSWLIDRPVALALTQEVIEHGPWGERPDPAFPRTVHEALPGDRVRFTAQLVDVDGPLDPTSLDFVSYLCDSPTCVVSATFSDAVDCPRIEASASGGICHLGTGSPLEVEVAVPTQMSDLTTLLVPPSIVMIGSPRAEGSAEDCLRRLDARELLGSCVLMSRSLAFGPPSGLVEAFQGAGFDFDISESQAAFLALARNHNPAVTQFLVEDGHGVINTLPAGSTFHARPGDTVTLAYAPVPGVDVELRAVDDPDAPGGVRYVEEQLGGRWFGTHPDLDIDPGNTLQTRFVVPETSASVRLHFVVRDDRGAEHSGGLILVPAR